MSTRSIAVQISGREYRIKSDADEKSLQRVAQHVDQTMALIRKRTGTVDSLEVALLTALNLARELGQLRESMAEQTSLPSDRLRELIELAESTVQAADSAHV